MIIKNIKECDLFIALLTKNFELSSYANQEIGIAIAHRKTILPVQVDVKACGFTRKFQASRKLDRENISGFIAEFIKALQADQSLHKKVLDSLIDKFATCRSFNGAKQTWNMIDGFDKFSKEQLNKIAEACIDNDQIRGFFGTSLRVRVLFRIPQNRKALKPEILEKLKEIHKF